jgi:hypothetical protein
MKTNVALRVQERFLLLAPLFLLGSLAPAQTPSASLTASASSYAVSGGELTLTAAVAYPGLTPSAVGYTVNLPAGWTLTRIAGPNAPEVRPPVPASGPLEFAYTSFPSGGASFTLTVTYPAALSSPQTITASAIYRSPRADLAIPALTLSGASTAAPPLIQRGPTGVTVIIGQPIQLSVEATGTAPLLYQWRRGDSVIAGATTAQLQIPAATSGDAGSYVAVVSNASGSAVSAPAVVVVNVPDVAPQIVTRPASLQVFAGQPATLSVTASGTPPLTYQWRRDGIVIPGATNSSLNFPAARLSDTGFYEVIVSNSVGQATSLPRVTLTVLSRPATGNDYLGRLPQGGAYALISRPGQTGIFLAWTADGIVASRQVPVALASGFRFAAPLQSAVGEAGSVQGQVSEFSGLQLRIGDTSFPLTAPLAGTTTGPGPGLHILREAGTATTGWLAVTATGEFLLAGRAAGQRFTGSGRIDAEGVVRGTSDAGGEITGLHAPGPRTMLLRIAQAGRSELVLVGSDPDLRPALERLVNLSTRSAVGAGGGGELITGFVVSGSAAKRLLVRATGPTLGAFGVAGPLPEPVLELYRGSTLAATGRGWDRGADAAAVAAAVARAGAFPFPAGSADAALLPSLNSGAYTAAIRAGTGAGGIALAEVYDLESGEPGAARLVNLSARARGEGGERTFTVGFVVSGSLPKAVLIRGIGPALGGFGVPDTMADPQLILYRDGVAVARNLDWGLTEDPGSVAAAAAAVGAFPLAAGSRDAAILVNLYSGAYTVEIAPQTGAGGQVLAEVYELP